MPTLSIIIVTFNSAPHIGKLLLSISRSRDKLSKEILLVDNASTDTTLDVIKKSGVKLKLFKNKTNLGFAKAVNRAVKQAAGEYVLLLNPDTKIVGNSLNILVEFARRSPLLGAVVPRLIDPHGRSQPSAFHFPTIANALRRYLLNQPERYGKYLPPAKTVKLEIAVMAAFLVPRTVFEAIGLLDERFFLYYEDLEFCRRLKYAGLPIYYYPLAKVIHIHGASGSFRSHHDSHLVRSAITYHGAVYFNVLNLVLWAGQKFELLLKRLKLR